MTILEAIEQFDLEGYVQGHGASQVQAHEWLLTCPECLKEKLTVNTKRRVWHCWVCEEKGPPDPLTGRRRTIRGGGGVVRLIQTLEECGKAKAVELILAAVKPELVDVHAIPDNLDLELVAGLAELPNLSPVPISPPDYWLPVYDGLPYLAERGITFAQAQAFGLTWCQAGRYRGRLVFPVWEQGMHVYYQARAMWRQEDQPAQRYVKTLNPPRTDGAAVSSEVLLNLDNARLYPRVAITEGPIDAVKTGPDAVCTFGKKMTPVQLAKLLRAGVRAIDLMWDGPTEREPHGAWPEMLKLAPTLSALFDTRLVFLPRGDPGDYDQATLAQYRQHARPAEQVSHLARV